jgi:hypothetical protein
MNPEYYDLPTSQAKDFGLCKNRSENNIMKSYVDSTGQVARVTTFRDIATGNMKKIETKLWTKINEVFPSSL